jgi:hypothetical protein
VAWRGTVALSLAAVWRAVPLREKHGNSGKLRV